MAIYHFIVDIANAITQNGPEAKNFGAVLCCLKTGRSRTHVHFARTERSAERQRQPRCQVPGNEAADGRRWSRPD